jgi:hypothetical protein
MTPSSESTASGDETGRWDRWASMIWWREDVEGVKDSNMEEGGRGRARVMAGRIVGVVVAMGYVARRDRGGRPSGIDIRLGDWAVMGSGGEGFRILTVGMGRRLLEAMGRGWGMACRRGGQVRDIALEACRAGRPPVVRGREGSTGNGWRWERLTASGALFVICVPRGFVLSMGFASSADNGVSSVGAEQAAALLACL